MGLQFSVALRNARLDATESTVGTAPLLRFYTGSEPANCAASATGTKLVEMTLPSDWEANASGGSKALLGTWSGTGLAAGSIGYYRLYDSTGTTCHEQGDVTASGGGGTMTVDNVVVAVSQAVSVTSYTLTDGNA